MSTSDEIKAFERELETSGICEICGKPGPRASWKHQECEDVLIRRNRSPQDTMRRQWWNMAKRMTPMVLRKNDGKCLKCGVSADTVDHTIPISKGGTNDFENLQPMCMGCNRIKKNRL